jgi:hypothetical protein
MPVGKYLHFIWSAGWVGVRVQRTKARHGQGNPNLLQPVTQHSRRYSLKQGRGGSWGMWVLAWA